MLDLVPRVEVFPCKLTDGNDVVLRARLTISLVPLVGGPADAWGGLLETEAVVDLFDPPQREAFRTRVVALRAEGRTERAAAAALGLTVTAAQNAVALDRRMRARGRTDAYEYLTAPVDGRRRNARHRHPRYEFRPLPEYPAQPPDPRPAG